jgi:hypothetical protein
MCDHGDGAGSALLVQTARIVMAIAADEPTPAEGAKTAPWHLGCRIQHGARLSAPRLRCRTDRMERMIVDDRKLAEPSASKPYGS